MDVVDCWGDVSFVWKVLSGGNGERNSCGKEREWWCGGMVMRKDYGVANVGKCRSNRAREEAKRTSQKEEHIRNGPPLVGKFSNDTVNATPTPPGLAVADTLPLILPRGSFGLKNEVEGGVAA